MRVYGFRYCREKISSIKYKIVTIKLAKMVCLTTIQHMLRHPINNHRIVMMKNTCLFLFLCVVIDATKFNLAHIHFEIVVILFALKADC